MASNQNPIHRDRDKRVEGEQPFRDNKEAMSQKEAQIDRAAPLPESEGEGLTDEQRNDLRRQDASRRLSRVGDEVRDSDKE